ncbi:MAG TPA: DeoR/GlpR family DNA-binding transcription regulator [Acidisoma sp.]|jgi:DeoR family fructose operon transcriptional repressor|nr:DeoR/GlpR family DNA-binding transcription regulator [Acidisoma sp.]
MGNSVQSDRLAAIRRQLYQAGSQTIQDLATATGASEPTIRRDLKLLEEEGVIERVHGGARLMQAAGSEIAFDLREQRNIQAKRAIAEAAYGLLRPGQTVFFDAGTTMAQLARRLRVQPVALTVVTNGLTVAQELSAIPEVRVMLIGGDLRAENMSLVGPQAEAMLAGIWCDQLFLGAGAVADDGAIYSKDDREASLNALMLKRAAHRVLLADASKFGLRTTYRVTSLAELDVIVTDAGMPGTWRDRLGRLPGTKTRFVSVAERDA